MPRATTGCRPYREAAALCLIWSPVETWKTDGLTEPGQLEVRESTYGNKGLGVGTIRDFLRCDGNRAS